MKKAVFFDIDGTLLDSSNGADKMSPAVKKSIRELQEHDNYVFIASGRPYAFLCRDILDFGFDGFLLMNGSLIMLNEENMKNKYNGIAESKYSSSCDSEHSKKILYKNPFDKNLLRKLIKVFEQYNIQYILQDEKYSYLNDSFSEMKKIYDYVGIPKDYIRNEYNLDDINVYKIEMFCLDERSSEICRSLENEEFRYTYYDEFNLFELYSSKNTKASGIIKLLDYLDIDVENSYAFGDGRNDIEMLNTVGCGIAMGNASEDVKIHADRITEPVHQDGIALGIKNFILNPCF
ncbi:HAD family hydrolase [uncultured Clostridium sp.]|uniref:HAD family hydrolase n=1 Tax=uncultured Clostridium sp. TaxID=59620 RepID=UPI0025CFE2C3|nr:HAD family hydrolase [uncultured Clostridium sp.]